MPELPKNLWDWAVANIQSWPSIPPLNLIAFIVAVLMLAPLVMKGLRALRSDSPAASPPAAGPLPPFFSVEMPWVTGHLVNIDSNQQLILQMLRDENGRNRLADIIDRLDVHQRRLEAIERRQTRNARKA